MLIEGNKLKKGCGPIVFLGSMNAMPMMYAMELKKLGYDVLYFVDRPRSDLLNRPENHFVEIDYPYPSWIVEFIIPSQVLLAFFRSVFSKIIENKIKKRTRIKPQAIFLNGFFISLSPFLYDKDVFKIALPHGSDLDTWANVEKADSLVPGMSKRSVFKFLPFRLASVLIRKAVFNQFSGFLNSNVVLYFPKGFNSAGDEVIDKLVENDVCYQERYDISFEVLGDASREFKKVGEKMVILSAVRFLYKTFPEGNEGYSKGNDVIIQGIARFYEKNKDIEVHFFEKGEDVEDAKLMCERLGIDHVVTWHKQMPFISLLDLYEVSDVCFDQVGNHWISAVGAYAMYLGKPLIANDDPAVNNGIWPRENPVFTARTAGDVCDALEMIRDGVFDLNRSESSKAFAEKYFGPSTVIDSIFRM